MRDQVRLVGIAMIAMGAINLMLYGASLAINLLGVGANLAQGMPGVAESEQLGFIFGYGLVSLLPAFNVLGGLLWIIAGVRLMGMHNRMFAVVMLILGGVPCCFTNPCCTWILTLPVAIWGLVVLFSTDVETAFLESELGAMGPLG